MLSAFLPIAPWDSVLKAAADGPFWDRELKEPALLFTVGLGKNAALEPSWVERQVPEEASAAEGSGGKRKRNRKRKPDEGRKPQQAQPQAKSKGKGKGKDDHPRKGKDGDYIITRDGSQICFAWNGSATGCGKTCSNNRAHVCRKRLQPHRSINCGGGGERPHT